MVPRLTELIGAQLELAGRIQTLISELWDHVGEEPEEGDTEVVDISVNAEDSETVKLLKRRVAKRVRAYRRGWNEVQALGAVVKDTATGLVDFYGRIDDRLVCLCWRYGEDSIDYYHELDDGFVGRKPLGEARNRMLN